MRLRFVRGRVRWFLRHFLTDFLPSIPGLYKIRALRAVRIFRYLRLVRVYGFFTRGIDSLVRRYGHALNRNVVPRSDYLHRVVVEGDRVEILEAVGGG